MMTQSRSEGSIGSNTVYSVLYNEAQYTVDRVETYLFYGRDRRRVFPGRTCDIESSRLSAVRLWALITLQTLVSF